MVITVTMNPAFDKTIIVDDFQKNSLNKINTKRIDLGGKGINVSKILTTLQIENKALILAGDMNLGELEKEIKKNNINAELIINENFHTRENIKIKDNKTNSITEINEKGKIENISILNKFKKKYKEIITENDIVVISGSVPEGTPNNFYKELIEIAKNKNAYVILDASGIQLENSIEGRPNLIKPNDEELSEIKFSKDDILKKQIEILLSKGKNGFEYLGKKEHCVVEGFKVETKSTVGAGDSLLAGFIYGLSNKLSLKESLLMGRACATAKVSTEGTAQVPKKIIDKYYVQEGLEWLKS